MNEQELKDRTKRLALRVMRLMATLPQDVIGKSIGSQLIRSATSVGANYRAACRGRSRAEFAAKLGIVVEEADETAYWLELIIDSGLIEAKLVAPLLQEANEITAIMVASRRSTQQRVNKSQSE